MLKRLCVCFIVSLILCACCSKKSQEVVTFSSWGSITEVKILEKVISDFETENPNIKINFIHIPQNYFQKIHLLFASNTEPDVIFINNLQLPVYEKKLMDLSDIVNKQEFFPQSIESLSYQGKLLAAPRDISNFVFYYNKKLAGNIDENWSFDDFTKIIKKCKISFEPDIFYAQPYILTLGNDKGLDFYKNLEGNFAPTRAEVGSSTLAQMFLDEKIVFYLSGRWMYPKIEEKAKFPFGVITFPGLVSADASGWAISQNTKHKESSIKFIKYLSSKKTIDYFTKTGLIIPARIDSSKQIKETAFLNAVGKSVHVNIDKNYQKNRDKLNKKLFN